MNDLKFNNNIFISTSQFNEECLNNVRSYISSYARAWNPYFFNYIEGSRSRLTILNVSRVYNQFKNLSFFIRNIYSKNGKLLVINKFEAEDFIQHTSMTIFNKWIPGILTNKAIYFRMIKNSGYSLQLPSVVLLMKTELNNVSFLSEAKKLKVPSVAFTETHFNHLISDYISLLKMSNDSSIYYMELFKSIKFSSYHTVALSYINRRYALLNINRSYNSSIKKLSPSFFNKFSGLKRLFIKFVNKKINKFLSFNRKLYENYNLFSIASNLGNISSFSFVYKFNERNKAKKPKSSILKSFSKNLNRENVRSFMDVVANKKYYNYKRFFKFTKYKSRIRRLLINKLRTDLLDNNKREENNAVTKDNLSSNRMSRLLYNKMLRNKLIPVFLRKNQLRFKLLRSPFESRIKLLLKNIKKQKGVLSFRRRRLLFINKFSWNDFLLRKERKNRFRKQKFNRFSNKNGLTAFDYRNKIRKKDKGIYIRSNKKYHRSKENKKGLNKLKHKSSFKFRKQKFIKSTKHKKYSR